MLHHRCWALFTSIASTGTHGHLHSAPRHVEDIVSDPARLVGTRRTWREQEVNEATEGAVAPVASFTSCSFPIWVSPLARWEWQLASVSSSPPCSLLSAAATHHSSLLPTGAQGVSSCPSPCHRWGSGPPLAWPSCKKRTAMRTAVQTVDLPYHLRSLRVFWLPQAFCKSHGNEEIHQK